MAILIKRYANRKLYNTDTSRYITLKGIAELLDQGTEVRVIDNETGEDITEVALSQILLDSKRSNTSPPGTLISQIFGRGGDALYGALRKGMDDATDGFGEFQERVRRIVVNEEESEFGAEGSSEPTRSDDGETRGQSTGGSHKHERAEASRGRPGLGSWLPHGSPDLERLVQNVVERVFRVLDMPRRSDIEALNNNLERVASAVETLEKSFAQQSTPRNDPEQTHPAQQ
jgi:polyhydroxyalkanoate synthesis repressor PhaR